MVQVLPYVPSFGESLIPAITKAGSDIGEGLKRRSANLAWEKLTTPQQSSGQQNPAMPGQPAAQPQSYLDQVLSKPGGPTADDAMIFIDAAEKRSPGSGKFIGDMFLNSQKTAGKHQSQVQLKQMDYQHDINKKRMEDVKGQRETINEQRQNYNIARKSIQSGDVGAFSPSSFANLLGPAGKGLIGPNGALLSSATKGLLFNNINKITAKATNLWLEKVSFSALPELGKSNEANESLIIIGLGKLDVDEKYLDTKDRLLAEYESQGLAPPVNIDQLTNELVRPYAQQVENQMAYDTRVIYEKSKGKSYLNNLEPVPKGTPLTQEKAQALLKKFNGDREKAESVAKKLGYEITSENTIVRNSINEEESPLDPGENG